MANPEHLDQLLKGVLWWNTWRRRNRDLPIDLSDANLSDRDLSEIRLDRANLIGADLRRCILSDSWLNESLLGQANLRGADLRGSRLGSADLTGANFENTELRSANFNGASANGARFLKANLDAATLKGASLNEADFSEAVLWHANLQRARLGAANLFRADLREADLSDAQLRESNLNSANLRFAKLDRADLTGADLRAAHADQARFIDSNLTGAALFRAGLSMAKMSGSNLTGADLRAANLLQTEMIGCTANDVKLWESQRSGWNISGIVCKRAFWDRDAKEPTPYELGEFERLYAAHACIELYYQGGVSTFELNTLPALLHHLASLHHGADIRLKSIEETGGGAKISISVADADSETVARIKADAMNVYKRQLALRENEVQRLMILNEYLETSRQENLIKSIFAAVKELPALQPPPAPQIINYGTMTGTALAGGNAHQNVQMTINDVSAVLSLLKEITNRRAELDLPDAKATELESELHSTTAELARPNPDSSVLKTSIGFIQKLAGEAITKAAGKLGESAVTDWQSWLHQLGQFIHKLS